MHPIEDMSPRSEVAGAEFKLLMAGKNKEGALDAHPLAGERFGKGLWPCIGGQSLLVSVAPRNLKLRVRLNRSKRKFC